ncbi:MAG: NUDIX domain-containing protein [Angelakisella sp.]|nr:NUDIX domain-containing protein [Angelakisella sp.]
MSIRNTVKAVILQDGKILLNLCFREGMGEYYTLPGGGQLQYESLEEALIRECAEETGYCVHLVRFLALYEEIYSDINLRRRFPDYAHKCYHVFLCAAEKDAPVLPSQPDLWQKESRWVEVLQLESLPIYPRAIGNCLGRLIAQEQPQFLGTVIHASEQPG